MGYDNGEVQIRHVDNPNKYLQIKMHDGHQGAITSFRLDRHERYAITTAEDGLMFVHQIDMTVVKKEALFDPFEGVEGVEFIPEATKDDIKEEKTKQMMLDNQPYFPDVDRE